MAGNSGDRGRSVTSKVVAVLEAFGSGEVHSLTELSHLTGLPMSTVHRLVGELMAGDALTRTEDGRYRIARGLGAVGGASTVAPSGHDLVRAAMMDLATATQSNVRLGILEDVKVSYIQKRAGHSPVTGPIPTVTLPAHATAMGKALLAFSSAQTVERVISSGLRRYTPHTLTTAKQLTSALTEIRLSHLAVSRSELTPGSSAIAVPVFGCGGVVVAALELEIHGVGPEALQLQPALTVAACGLSRQLAYQPGQRVVQRPLPISRTLIGAYV